MKRRLLPNSVLDVVCWAEDNCMPEIREQGDCCPEADGREISLCPSDRDNLFLLFCAKRLQDKCKAPCWVFIFQPHPVNLLHAYFIKHTENAESLIRKKVGLFRQFEMFGVRDLNISRKFSTFLREDGQMQREVSLRGVCVCVSLLIVWGQ